MPESNEFFIRVLVQRQSPKLFVYDTGTVRFMTDDNFSYNNAHDCKRE
jgi:hypothetical protein